MQHHVGPQVASFLVLDVVLRLVVDAFGQGRVVEDRFEQHLAPVALHLRVAFECLREVLRLGRNVLVEFHEPFELGPQFAALRGLRGIDLLDTPPEVGDVVPEGFEQQVDRLPARLAEMLRLLAQDLRGEVPELRAEPLLGRLPFGFLCGVLFGYFFLQGRDFGLRRGAQRRQLGFRLHPLLREAAYAFLLLPLRLSGRSGRLGGGGQTGLRRRQARRGVAFARLGFAAVGRMTLRVPAPQPQQQD